MFLGPGFFAAASAYFLRSPRPVLTASAKKLTRCCLPFPQALVERIRPVLTVNKLDRCFLELMLDGEEAYNGFRRTMESANVIMATYADELLGDTQVYPEKGTVSFSAGLHGWAFTLTVFADLYAKKFGVEVRCRGQTPFPSESLFVLGMLMRGFLL
jgi:hypothetical protein